MLTLFIYIANYLKSYAGYIPGLHRSPTGEWYINYREYRQDERVYQIETALLLHKLIHDITQCELIPIVDSETHSAWLWTWEWSNMCYYYVADDKDYE